MLILGVLPLVRIIVAGFRKCCNREEPGEDPSETDVDEISLPTLNSSLESHPPVDGGLGFLVRF